MTLTNQMRKRINSSRTLQKGNQDDYRSKTRTTLDR